MASRSKHERRPERGGDTMEAIKPLIVLGLFGTILYGAYSVVQKGPSPAVSEHADAGDAPPFEAPSVEMAAPTKAVPPPVENPPAPPAEVIAASPAAPPTPPPTRPSPLPNAPPPASPQPATVVAVPEPPASPVTPPEPPAAASAAPPPPVYLAAESSPPPDQDDVPSPSQPDRPDRLASLPEAAAPVSLPPQMPPPAGALPSSAAFATAWSDAHEKLSTGRYAEALTALSVWYDDPSLGLEESHRLEDLLGQLAGTVIYSQQHLLMPPHVVAAGETLQTIAAPLGISSQLLGKINGISEASPLVPGEHLKVIRGPFDAVVSVSRRRLSLQLRGAYAGSFPVVVGRHFLPRVGSTLAVEEIRRDVPTSRPMDPRAAVQQGIVLADGLVIEAAADPSMVSDDATPASLIVSVRDLVELSDILGPGSSVLIRQ